MNNEPRNFYEESQKYDDDIVEIKELINKIISINNNELKEKIELLDKENKYIEFIDLLNAVLGNETNIYYYCENEEDVKYYGLEMYKVYKISTLNIDLQSKYNKGGVLKLQARAQLAQQLTIMTHELKQLFSLNLDKTDGNLSTLEFRIIREEDVEYFNNLIKYLDIIIDKTGRLKILDAERDVYSLRKARDTYDNKSKIAKWFYKTLKKENSVIENIDRRKR